MLTLRVVVAIAGVTTVAMLPIGCGPTSPRSTLVGASSSDYPPRFEFVDRPDAASLMECLGAAETLVVTVDTEQDAMAVRREDETSPVVVWTAQASFVDARLLTGESGWVRVGRDMAEPQPGELLAIMSAGAYGAVQAGTYNSRLLVPEVLVKGDRYSVIRPRPSYEDLIGLDKIPDWL